MLYNIIKNMDYIKFLNKIEDNSIDLILIDPPYGKINNMKLSGQKQAINWDIEINWTKMFNLFNKKIKKGGTILVFGQNPTYSNMILSNIKQFKYEYIWIKNNCAQGFHKNKMPLIFSENIAVFIKNGERTFKKPFKPKEINKEKFFTRWYSQQLFYFINKTRREIHKFLGHRKTEFFFYFTGKNFQLCSKKIYKELKKKFNIKKFKYFLTYNELEKKWNKEKEKNKNIKLDSTIYNGTYNNILTFSKDPKPYFHPTQKPLKLLEQLIKTHSNENEIVLDCFAGSGSTLLASKNTNRKFLGCELDKKYYKIALKRLKD